MFVKSEISILQKRMVDNRRFIQVIMGPRQVGKTTMVKQLIAQLEVPTVFVAADGVASANSVWISQQWQSARFQLLSSGAEECILIIDEIQKIDNWAEVIKMEWDKDSIENKNIKLVLLGSARLLLQRGLSESLAGRFEIIQMTHWSFAEMQEAFDFSVEQFVYFGGYPGAASLIDDEERWREYVLHSLIETTLSKDILMMSRVDKPSLLRRLFELGCGYSGQILSMTKLLGQLQDAGNTTTLSHYLELLDSAGLLTGLEKYAPDVARQKMSIPKWQVQNTAFSSVYNPYNFEQSKQNPDIWGRCVETAVGVHLIRSQRLQRTEVTYWREGNDEIDFVLKKSNKVIGIEVKSGRTQSAKGIIAFEKKVRHDKVLLIGNSGIPWQNFLKSDVNILFEM
ncbi:ATP-binding protein [Arcicella sp. LKC2W]|uniref:ATP-binding protein n=1 Tax=Arcicella sp. LKC2W TaxID=2984198 RepID=UPI002B1EF9D5|nr:ATP-binding protein [Arcicella sp. LKC2W]MEA5457627.1 ATP-binding protein [Arcicella sp. LKC2W]